MRHEWLNTCSSVLQVAKELWQMLMEVQIRLIRKNRFVIPYWCSFGILLLIVSSVSYAQGTGATSLTIEDAIRQALLQNDRVGGAALGVRRARAARDTARALYFPEISLSATSLQADFQTTLNLDPLRQIIVDLNPNTPPSDIAPFKFQLSRKFDVHRAQVTAKWPIFTGGRIQAANRVAVLGMSDAAVQERAIRDSVIVDVVVRYYGLRLAQEALNVRDSALAVVERHAEDARLLEKHGQISRAERLRADVARAEALRDRNTAAREVVIAGLALGSVLATSDSTVAVSPFFDVHDLPPVAYFASVAEQANPALQRLGLGREMAAQGVTAQRGNWLPQVALIGFHQVYQNDLTKYLNVKPLWAIGAIANWELFGGFKRPKAIQAAKLVMQEVEHRERQAQRDIRILVEQLYNRLLDAEGEMASFDSTDVLATESLRAQQKAFSNGFATSLDVLDAQLSLSRVKLGKLAALYAYHQALIRLLQATGQTEKFLDYLEPPVNTDRTQTQASDTIIDPHP